MEPGYIERRIVTGLIVSTNYIRRVRTFWKPERLESAELRRVAGWCWDYFEKYNKAPDSDIESIFRYHVDLKSIPKAEMDLIERILSRASRDFGRGEQFSAAYLYDQTVEYFRRRELDDHTEKVKDLLDRGRVEEATKLQMSYQPSSFSLSGGVELGSDLSLQMIDEVFSESAQRVLHFPGALGDMLNEHLIRGGFVAFMAPEKRGKTWVLLEVALRALTYDKTNVAFFAAGDMTERQMLRRISVYLTKQSDQEKYAKAHWRAVGDCALNQLDICERKDRNCDFGVYDGLSLKDWQDQLSKLEAVEPLVDLAKRNPNYRPCSSRSCRDRCGTVWLEKEPERPVLSPAKAKKAISEFVARCKRRLKIKAYDTGTLSSAEILSQLDTWEKEDDFVPDLVLVDYADLMTANTSEFRHRQNLIWMGLRGVSLNRDCLVVTVTQSDAESYKLHKLNLSSFSEDKRKYSHVTAMWALNQDPKGREKKLGLLRIGELLVREGESDPQSEVVVMQDLAIGRPFMGSFRR